MKTPAQTCGPMGPHHAYLGRFRQAKHLNRGHNGDPIQDLADTRALGGLPSDQERLRQRRDRAENVRKEAEENVRQMRTLDSVAPIDAPGTKDRNEISVRRPRSTVPM